MAVKFKPFTPWDPTPPHDRYDPSLDATLAAGERGYGDLVTDAATGNRRAVEDYGFGKSDLERAQTRGHEDIGTQRRYGTEDYHRNVGLLQRQYRQLGNTQGGQARVMGVNHGGALVAAARARDENQAIDRQPLDTGFTRLNEGLNMQGTRLDEDTGTGIARLGVGLERGVADRGLGVQRAGREQVFLGTDTAAAKSAQAAQTGWDPGARPANEFAGALGPHRVLIRGNQAVGVDPAGHVLFRRPRRKP